MDFNADGTITLDASQFNTELQKVMGTLDALTKKLGDLDKVDFSTLSKTVAAMDAQLSGLANNLQGSGNIGKRHANAKIRKTNSEARLNNAEAAHVQAEADILSQQAKNYLTILDNTTKKVNAYAEFVSKQMDKNMKTQLAQSKISEAESRNKLRSIQGRLLEESGQRRFTNNFQGGIAQMMTRGNSYLRNRGGITGAMTTLGERLGSNPNSFLGRKFGSVLKDGTAGGLGINAAGLALGGFTAALGKAVEGIYDFSKASLDAYASMQKLSVNLDVVYGSKTQSTQAFSDIQHYAVHSPFSVSQTTEMAVLLKQSGVYASELQNTLEMIGDVSSGNEEKMKRIANNYAQIQAIGHATMLDMRQFAYAGLPIYEEVAKYLKVSQDELRSMISSGKVTSEIIENVFKRMTGEGGTFDNAVMRGAQTLAARKTNLQDTKNISLSNWGDWLWNKKSPDDWNLSRTVLGTMESFWSQVGTWGKQLSVNQNEKMGMASRDLLKYLTDAYEKALSKNNKPLATFLGKELSNFRFSNRGEAEVISAFNQKLESLTGIDTSKVVSDAEYDFLEDRLLSLRNDLQSGNIAFDKINSVNEEIQYLQMMLSEMKRQSDLDAELVALQKGGKSHLVDAYYKTQNEKWELSIVDAVNKLASGAESLNSLTAKYNAEYKNSKEGKEEEKKKEELDYENYRKQMSSVLNVYDPKTGRFKVKGKDINKDSIIKAWDSRLFEAEGFSFYKGNMKEGEFKKEMRTLTGNMDDLKETLRENFKDELSKEDFEKLLKKISDVRSSAYLSAQDSKNADYLNKNINELHDYMKNNALPEDIVKIINYGFTKLKTPPEIAKRGTQSGSGKENLFIPLWKRIFAGATGWGASNINTNGAKAMEKYLAYQQRQISTGGLQGLVSTGGGLNDISGLLRYNGKTAQYNTAQIDWAKTEKEMLSYAMSMKGSVKQVAGILGGMTKAMESQLSVYEKLTVDMFAVGEDWATINKEFTNMKTSEAMFLENAFSGDIAQSGDRKFGVGFSAEKRSLVLKNTGINELEGKTIEELKDAVKDGTITDNKLVEVISNLTIRSESIKQELEKQRYELQALTDTVKLATSIAKQSADWDEQASLTWGKALGGTSGGITSLLRASGVNPGAMSKESKSYLGGFTSSFAGSLLSIDTKNWNNKAIKEYVKEHGGGEDFSDAQLDNIREAVKEFQNAPESFEKLQKVFEAMGKPVAELADSAERLAKADKSAKTLQAADDVLNNTPLSFSDAQDATKSIKNLGVTPDQIGIIDLLRNSRTNGNTFQQQLLLSERGYEDESFKDFSKRMTDQAIFKKEKKLTGKYKVAGNDFIADMLGDDTHGQLFQNAFSEAINTGDFEEARNIIKLLGGDFDALTESINQAALTSGSLGERFINLGKQLGGLMKDFAGSTLTSTFETLGKSVGESADSSKALRENFRQLGSGLMQNMGTMITQAGLAMIIGAGRDKKMIYAGLALAAAGVGASFLSGLLSADKSEDDKDDGEMQKLLNLKNDLADLLKQAREDAIYYENTVRHKNAISANEAFKTTKVNDAIITPSGNVISTHPDDYLIATKTPQTLVGSGAPTINFSVIDKSTGIQVTKQTSVYNRNDNSIDFEAVIESKVQEIIATSKGDDAFAARQARLDGRRVIA